MVCTFYGNWMFYERRGLEMNVTEEDESKNTVREFIAFLAALYPLFSAFDTSSRLSYLLFSFRFSSSIFLVATSNVYV